MPSITSVKAVTGYLLFSVLGYDQILTAHLDNDISEPYFADDFINMAAKNPGKIIKNHRQQ